MRIYNAIVVDDERYAREEICFLLEQYQDIKIVSVVNRGVDVQGVVEDMKPDVIFLDIEMPRLSGLEIAKELQASSHRPEIIFTTAYPQFAAEAFRVEALDYLLKPFKVEQLDEAISKLRECKEVVSPEASVLKLQVESRGAIHYINIDTIAYIHTKGKTTQIFTKDHTYNYGSSLKEAEEKLSQFGFFRTHRSFLVNVSYISKITPWYNGAYEVELDGFVTKIAVSRNYARTLIDLLQSQS